MNYDVYIPVHSPSRVVVRASTYISATGSILGILAKHIKMTQDEKIVQQVRDLNLGPLALLVELIRRHKTSPL
ncbi:hypothetical protein DPMN_084439 [Dreissena polymorpha]|uniref:Uncharacterized protein n=1 Tax=Dreissena polymorpha TaxID=45954 RepID=A0A9D3YBT1_DREPO|nr:hypothetical protein DPMN_084439 [Dreissena polymorpha]